MLRVISGKVRGLKLDTPKNEDVRPTTDRVKESLFNIINPYIIDSNVLDLFAGTGNLTIEALSWGAKSVDSVEMHPKSLAIIKKNLEHLKITEGTKVIRSDVLKFLKDFRGDAYDLILIDPPFTEKMAHSVMETLTKSSVFHPNTIIMVEYSKHERMETEYETLKAFDTRSFGDKLVSFFKV